MNAGAFTKEMKEMWREVLKKIGGSPKLVCQNVEGNVYNSTQHWLPISR